jgi:hypothetical protein
MEQANSGKNPRIVRIFMDYAGSGELKSVLIHVISGPYLVIFKGNNYNEYLRAGFTEIQGLFLL